MSLSKSLLSQIVISFIFISLTSCVKDVDLDQAEDISLRPKLMVDLLFFKLDDDDLEDHEAGQPKITIRDTVRLEFLDDSYIQKDLTEVELNFKYKNSFSQDFINTISFLSESNQQQHVVKLDIGGMSGHNSSEAEKTFLIKGAQLDGIKNSIKMVMELEVLPGGQPFSGELKFESKGLFSFEF